MTPRTDPDHPDFWHASWQRRRAGSPFLDSQQSRPERWRAFYDGMTERDAAIWNEMGGWGEVVCDLLFRERVLAAGSRVLDVGCGFGPLAIPLARRGARVLGLDASAGMLRLMINRAGGMRPAAPQACVGEFETFSADPCFDLAVAACFPPALSPRGIRRLEEWSRGHTAVVLGTGSEVFPFRRDLYEAILETPLPSGRWHLTHLTGWLLASGRMPNLRHIRFPLCLDQPAAEMSAFFTRYFTIFGKSDSRTRRRIAGYFQRIAVKGRIRAAGCGIMAVLWWPASKTGMER